MKSLFYHYYKKDFLETDKNVFFRGGCDYPPLVLAAKNRSWAHCPYQSICREG